MPFRKCGVLELCKRFAGLCGIKVKVSREIPNPSLPGPSKPTLETDKKCSWRQL